MTKCWLEYLKGRQWLQDLGMHRVITKLIQEKQGRKNWINLNYLRIGSNDWFCEHGTESLCSMKPGNLFTSWVNFFTQYPMRGNSCYFPKQQSHTEVSTKTWHVFLAVILVLTQFVRYKLLMVLNMNDERCLLCSLVQVYHWRIWGSKSSGSYEELCLPGNNAV
jgi:hypothetical protein